MKEKKYKRPVGAGLSLDKFASLGVSKYDKRKKLESVQKQKVIQHSKYSKLKKKLEAQGVLGATPWVKDSIAELEALDRHGSEETPGEPLAVAARLASHAEASSRPRLDPQRGLPSKDVKGRPSVHKHQQQEAATVKAVGSSLAPLSQAPKRANTLEGQRDESNAGPSRKRQKQSGVPPEEPQQPRRAQPRREGPGSSGLDSDDGGHGGDIGGDGRGGLGLARKGRPQGAGSGAARGGSGGGANAEDAGYGHPAKKMSRLQRLAQKVAEEKAEKQRAKEAAIKEQQERLARVAVVEKARKEQKHLYLKRTSKGQPLMRFRMEKLLDKIQQGAAS